MYKNIISLDKPGAFNTGIFDKESKFYTYHAYPTASIGTLLNCFNS